MVYTILSLQHMLFGIFQFYYYEAQHSLSILQTIKAFYMLEHYILWISKHVHSWTTVVLQITLFKAILFFLFLATNQSCYFCVPLSKISDNQIDIIKYINIWSLTVSWLNIHSFWFYSLLCVSPTGFQAWHKSNKLFKLVCA